MILDIIIVVVAITGFVFTCCIFDLYKKFKKIENKYYMLIDVVSDMLNTLQPEKEDTSMNDILSILKTILDKMDGDSNA